MNDLPDSKTIIELLVGAVMTLAMSLFKLSQRAQERSINELRQELTTLKQNAATKPELEALYREHSMDLREIKETVTRSHERIDELLLIERGKQR